MSSGKEVNRSVAVVTGGAQGIGAAIARRLASDGMAVAVFDRNVESAASVVDEIKKHGNEAISFGVDVSNVEEVAAGVEDVANRLGPPTIIVNNAGFARDSAMMDMSIKDWDDVNGVVLKGSFLMTRAIQPYMAKAGWGRIINISSTSARGHADRVNYASAKAGMHGFVRALAVELGPLGITANAIAPGLIVTAMTEATAKRRGLSLEDHLSDAITRIPVRRAGKPEDIAAAVSFLASKDAGFVTGQVLYVSGGAY